MIWLSAPETTFTPTPVAPLEVLKAMMSRRWKPCHRLCCSLRRIKENTVDVTRPSGGPGEIGADHVAYDQIIVGPGDFNSGLGEVDDVEPLDRASDGSETKGEAVGDGSLAIEFDDG